ncbi:MAG: phage tail protein [Actinomycetota bacterium]|nr:phage tail protein [Actinomycetota bacterium]
MPSSDSPLGGDPPIANRFLFEVDGVEIGVFKEVRGLEVTVPTEEIREGGQNGFSYKVPGRMVWPNIVFRRGLTQSDALFTWMTKSSGEGFAGAQNKLKRSTGAITAITHTGKRLRSWQLQGVFPVRWKGPDFSIDNKSALEEELEITHHGFRAETHSPT